MVEIMVIMDLMVEEMHVPHVQKVSAVDVELKTKVVMLVKKGEAQSLTVFQLLVPAGISAVDHKEVMEEMTVEMTAAISLNAEMEIQKKVKNVTMAIPVTPMDVRTTANPPLVVTALSNMENGVMTVKIILTPNPTPVEQIALRQGVGMAFSIVMNSVSVD